MVQLYRFTQLLFSLFLAIIFSYVSGFAQVQVVEICTLENYSAINGHAVDLHNLPGAPTSKFLFGPQGGTLTIFDDGTAQITGTVQHESQANLQWEVNAWLINKRDFAAWTALGRGIKIENAPEPIVNANSADWDFYELDQSRSTLIGVPGTFYDGDTLFLSHQPSNFHYGYQLGIGANAKNGNEGLSGWFFYSGSYSGTGDFNVNKSCEAPACSLEITQVEANCINDTTFEVRVSFSGSGNQFEITDNLGSTPMSGLSAGTYTFNTYPNNAQVELLVTDMAFANCADTSAVITADCSPAPVCDLAIDSLASLCLTDTSFQVSVYVSGTGAYTLSDDQGSPVQTGGAGTYVFGPYANNTSVSFSATDDSLTNCSANAGPVSEDCTPPPPVCDLEIDSLDAVCLTDSTFEVMVFISGTLAPYQIDDDQGSPSQGTLGTTVYTFGPYPNNTAVSFTAFNTNDTTCTASAGPVVQDCSVDTCAVSIDDLVAECASDTSFTVIVTFSGIGNNFSISDNLGSPPMTGLSPGTYSFGDYFNSTDVFVTVSNPDFASCSDMLGPVTADCTPVPQCDVVLDTAYTNCITDSTFEVIVTFTGTGSLFQIFDNLGSPGVTNLAAGTYSYGVYNKGTQVQVTILDFAIFNCFVSTPVLTTDCDTTTGNGLHDGITNFTYEMKEKDVVLSWKSSLREPGTSYQIEKDSGNGTFEVIGERQLEDMDLFENKYFFADFSIEANKYLTYRIRQVKPGKESSFSTLIKLIRLEESKMLLGEIYPNPSSDFAQIKFNSGSPHRISCELIDMKGSLVSKSVFNTVVGSQELILPSKGLKPGMYLVRLRLENKKVFVRKLIITE